VRERLGAEVEAIETAVLQRDPQSFAPVPDQRLDRVEVERLRVGGIVLEAGDPAGERVDLREPAVVRADPHRAGVVLDDAADVGVVGVVAEIGARRAGRGIEIEDAHLLRADPDMATAVFGETRDVLAGEPERRAPRVARGLSRLAVELIEAVVGADPALSRFPMEEAEDVAAFGALSHPVRDPAVVRAIVAAQALARADPEDAVAILTGELDVVVGDRRAVAANVAVVRDRVAVVAVQPSARAEPHEATRILVDGGHPGTGQPVVSRELGELEALCFPVGGETDRARDRDRNGRATKHASLLGRPCRCRHGAGRLTKERGGPGRPRCRRGPRGGGCRFCRKLFQKRAHL
jgi:hypothetical protein